MTREEVDRFREKLEREMRSGVISLVLLLVIDRTGPDYGYRILRNIEQWSEGRLRLKEGTAYPVLQNLERAKLLTSFWGDGTGGPPRKYYQTTRLGKDALTAGLEGWRDLHGGVEQLVKNMPQEARP